MVPWKAKHKLDLESRAKAKFRRAVSLATEAALQLDGPEYAELQLSEAMWAVHHKLRMQKCHVTSVRHDTTAPEPTQAGANVSIQHNGKQFTIAADSARMINILRGIQKQLQAHPSGNALDAKRLLEILSGVVDSAVQGSSFLATLVEEVAAPAEEEPEPVSTLHISKVRSGVQKARNAADAIIQAFPDDVYKPFHGARQAAMHIHEIIEDIAKRCDAHTDNTNAH